MDIINDANAAHEPDELFVDELGPDDHGVWEVVTLGSRHIFDLDAMTYRRFRGEGRSSFDWDGEPVRLTRITDWPKVGSSHYIWFDDPADPQLEQWRISSTIQSIRRISGSTSDDTEEEPTPSHADDDAAGDAPAEEDPA